MATAGAEVPETRVLAIASHVTYGYVGNTMATFVMQSLGCEVSAINTVEYSNHTAYKQVKGRKIPAAEIKELYLGLQQSYLNDFDMMLSGYMPNAEVVNAVGEIGRDILRNAADKPGSFFWILDPVMGDEGRLYVAEDVVPAYKSIVPYADLILPNQFEAEVLSETTITDIPSLLNAIQVLHKKYRIPHVLITSVRFPEGTPNSTRPDVLTIIGSSATSDHTARPFCIETPRFPIFFSGTGDLFAALMVSRLRAEVVSVGLDKTKHWLPLDGVKATQVPLAKAAEKVLASMHAVLKKTVEAMDRDLQPFAGKEEDEKRRYLRKTKAAEVRVVRNVKVLIDPPDETRFEAKSFDF